MHAIPLLVTALRLTCWPFEVEGQGAPPTPASSAMPPAPHAPPLPPVASVALPASLPRNEVARYDVRYGILGSIGELTLSAGGVAYPQAGLAVVALRGSGRGAVLGLGGMERRIEAEFDVRALGSRRWTVVRRKDGQAAADETVDTGERTDRGEMRLFRRVPGKADETQAFTPTVPTSDPLGMIWRLRTAPPALGQHDAMLVLDGLALWQVRATTVALADPVPETGVGAWRIEGDVIPIDYVGRIDTGRTARTFTIWLDPRESHVPLRLEIPVGPADLVMQLVAATKSPAKSPPTSVESSPATRGGADGGESAKGLKGAS